MSDYWWDECAGCHGFKRCSYEAPSGAYSLCWYCAPARLRRDERPLAIGWGGVSPALRPEYDHFPTVDIERW